MASTRRSVALILAAGLGTRMRSTLPKVMHSVLGLPMIVHVVQSALDLGCDEVAIVVGHGRELVEASVRARFPDAPISFHVQAQQLGTGDAVRSAAPAYASGDPDVIVLSGDVPNTPVDLLRRAVQTRADAQTPVVVISATAPEGTAYGRIVRDADARFLRITEFKDADAATRAIREVNTGIYVFSGAFLREQIGTLSTDNAQGEFYLTDLVERAAASENHALALRADDIAPLDGVNTRVDLARANAVARDQKNLALMLAGVTLLDPVSTWIDADTTVEADVVIEPNVVLRGRTRVLTGAWIEAGVRLEDAHVPAERRIRAPKG